MKRLIFLACFFLFPVMVFAGAQDGQIIRKGFDYGVYAVTVGSTTPTLLTTYNTKKIDFVTRFENTDGYDLMICSSTFAKPATAANGCFPIKSGERVSPDGFFPGNMYVIMEQFSPSRTISIIEFYRQEY